MSLPSDPRTRSRAGIAVQHVVAGTAVHDVDARAAVDFVVAGVAVDIVVTAAAKNHIGPAAADNRVIKRAPVDQRGYRDAAADFDLVPLAAETALQTRRQ